MGEEITLFEINEALETWVLQMAYQKNINQIWDKPEWHSKINSAKIRKQRCKRLFHYLGKKLALTPVYEGSQMEGDKLCKIWGNFNHFHQTSLRLEEYIGRIEDKFTTDGLMDFAVDDDKIHHSGKRFRNLGLKMSCFRNCRLGPIMNCIGNAKT